MLVDYCIPAVNLKIVFLPLLVFEAISDVTVIMPTYYPDFEAPFVIISEFDIFGIMT